MKKALITGITGQDGSYLVELRWKKATRFGELFAGVHHSLPEEAIICLKTRISIHNSGSFSTGRPTEAGIELNV